MLFSFFLLFHVSLFKNSMFSHSHTFIYIIFVYMFFYHISDATLVSPAVGLKVQMTIGNTWKRLEYDRTIDFGPAQSAESHNTFLKAYRILW